MFSLIFILSRPSAKFGLSWYNSIVQVVRIQIHFMFYNTNNSASPRRPEQLNGLGLAELFILK